MVTEDESLQTYPHEDNYQRVPEVDYIAWYNESY